jgi:hypothetical protein
MRNIFILFIFIILFSSNALAQGRTNLFMGGYSNASQQLPWGGNKVDFYSGQAVVGQEFRAIDYNFTGNNITDNLGNLLFTTNGVIILNNVNDTMVNGTGLNPSTYTNNWNEGLRIYQQNVILPCPDSSTIFYMFHLTVNNMTSNSAYYFYYTKIDMSLDGGKGEAVLKNQILINDTLAPAGITACRHGNGRDWWILSKSRHGPKFFLVLLTPNGPTLVNTISLGYRTGGNQYCFSPDGTKLGSYGTLDDFEIFDFDRCSGILSNYRQIAINDSMLAAGAAFSPNSQYLYGSSNLVIYQVDATSNQPDTTIKTVALWDSTYSPFPPFVTNFWFQQLADDGKIYIATSNSTLVLHTIENPDLLDTLCNVQQHSITLPTYNTGTIPNFPNYNLGPLVGSPCDTLVGIHELFQNPINLKVVPNPNYGKFEVNYELPQNERGEIEIINILGELVYQNYLPQWSSIHRLDLSLPSGLYQVVVSTSKSKESKKTMIL